jgi:CheY-like chemotaxis protein/Flp pilus assembly protein TadD
MSFRDKKILLVDDQRSFQVLMKAMLNNVGFNKVTILGSAEEARRRCQKDQFDIYLLDYNLGMGENGRQLLEYLREQHLLPPDSIVFIISGDNSRAMVLSALESEPDGYMMKPFSQEQLRQRLQRALQRKQELSAIFTALDKEDFAAVISLCQPIIDSGSKFATYCRCLMAEMHIRLGDPAAARTVLRNGLAASESSWLRLGLGKVCHLLGQYEEAIAHLHTALRLRPLMVDAYRWLSAAQLASHNPQDALDTLSRATEISPQSSMLHRQLAEMALAQGDYLRAKDSTATMLELNRYDQAKNSQLLGSHVHCLILYAINSGDPFHIGNLQKQVNNALSRCRQALMEHEFDFAAFEQICQARVQVARGEMVRGKKMLYKAMQPYQSAPATMAPPLLSNMVLGLTQLGEYEFAEQLHPLLQQQDNVDPLLMSCVQTTFDDKAQQERQQKYRELNEQGIRAYTQGQIEEALGCFREALRRAPANTNAAINKAQALLQLTKNHGKPQPELLDECKATLALLDGVQLSPTQLERLRKLQEDLRVQKARP